jgi:hypothetical protein
MKIFIILVFMMWSDALAVVNLDSPIEDKLRSADIVCICTVRSFSNGVASIHALKWLKKNSEVANDVQLNLIGVVPEHAHRVKKGATYIFFLKKFSSDLQYITVDGRFGAIYIGRLKN